MQQARSRRRDHQVHHPIFARLYAKGGPAMERAGMAQHRQRLLADLSGQVLEVGCGPGGNFEHYPQAVDRLVAIEPEPHLRDLARRATADIDIDIEVTGGVAEQIAAPDDHFDAVVVSLVLCSVDDQHVALAEIGRVLRPGGQLRFLEHVQANSRSLRRVQRLLDATVWPRLGGGCHSARDTVAAIERSGFTVSEMETYRFPDGAITVPTSPHVLGTAVVAPTAEA